MTVNVPPVPLDAAVRTVGVMVSVPTTRVWVPLKPVRSATTREVSVAVTGVVSVECARPPLRKILVVDPLAPTTRSAKPSPSTSPTASEVADGVVRSVAPEKVSGPRPVWRYVDEVPARATTTSRRPSPSRSASATATVLPVPENVAAEVPLKVLAPVPR